MDISTLMSISPIDGRYYLSLQPLSLLFSEFALMRYRLEIEIRWFETLADCKEIKELPALDKTSKQFLEKIIENFSEQNAARIKEIEESTHHDVKAVEYFLKEKLKENPKLSPYIEFIHFGCTSEDINNLAYALILKEARDNQLLPTINEILSLINNKTKTFVDIPMLSRTHGQPASPTTLGKEFANFYHRIQRQINQIESIALMGKINGAVGNYNAHMIAYPNVDWLTLSRTFVESLDLNWNSHTTQIEPHDYIAELSHATVRLNNIFIDLSRDIWAYISNNYFKLKIEAGEVGSSTMPHKVNPIDFENAEGNLGLANSLLNFFANKLPISRLQRDLSDSTVLRNLGVAFAHSILAYQSLIKGLNKLEANQEIIANDLNNHWEVLAEAIQTMMRKHGIEQSYEKLKAFTQGKTIDKKTLHQFIDGLALPEKEKEMLKQLTPEKYRGMA